MGNQERPIGRRYFLKNAFMAIAERALEFTGEDDGFLRRVNSEEEIRTGIAVIDRRRCLDYTEEQSFLCQQCYRQCPLPDDAIYLEDSRPVIRSERCTGCGICKNVCQTVNPPSAINILPLK